MSGWLVGVGLCLTGAAGTCLGMNMQKLSHLRNDALPEKEQKGYVQQKAWVAGFAVFTVGQLLNLASLSFASQSLLATLSSFALVCNVFFAPCLLHEPVNWRHFMATVVIIGGSVVVVLFSAKTPQEYTLAQLVAQFEAVGFIAYAGVTGGVMLACIVFHMCNREHPWTAPICAFIAALLGSFSLLMGKCSMQLIKSTIADSAQLKDPATYAIITVFIMCAVSNIHFINMGLQSGSALLVVPMYYVLNMLFSIASGIIYFQEWSQFTTTSAIMFSLGVLLTVIGVFVLSRIDAGVSDDDSGDETSTHSNLGAVDEEAGSAQPSEEPKPRTTMYGALPQPSPLQLRGSSYAQLRSSRRTRRRSKRGGPRRFSLQPTAFPGSFPNRARRRYSVAVLGVGIA